MDISSCYRIGLISKPHGLKGEVTVLLDSHIPNDFASLDTVLVEQAGSLVPYFIQTVSVTGNKAFTKFEDVDNLEQAQEIAKCPLFLPKTARPTPAPGTFYDDEIFGFDVEDEQFGPLGKVAEIIQSGLQRLLAIDTDSKEILIPIEGPFIQNIDREQKKILVLLPEGFLEL